VTSRFDVERAVMASDLPASARLVMFVLLAHCNANPVEIPAKFGPSLSALKKKTGLARSTVCSILDALEAQGWLIRDRPAVEQSRKHVRTRYQLAIPKCIQATLTKAQASPLTELAPTGASPATGPFQSTNQDQAIPSARAS
jgi:DNA-binding MarR family transcriptional regulator